jgi:hypothetical protein
LLTVNALVTMWPAQFTFTGTRPGASLRGILTWIQPYGIACENGFLAIVTVSVHASRGVVVIVTVPPGATCVRETESWKPDDADARPADTQSAATATVRTASHLPRARLKTHLHIQSKSPPRKVKPH